MGTNPTSYPDLPDFSDPAMDASTYKARLDGTATRHAQVAGAFAPSAQRVPDMTVRVAAGTLLVGGVLLEVDNQSTASLAAPVADPRIDLVHVDPGTGEVGVTSGVEDTLPTAPPHPAGTIPVALVHLEAGFTEISDLNIEDIRAWCMVLRPGIDLLTPDGDGSCLTGVTKPGDLGTAAALDTGLAPGNIPLLEDDGAGGGTLPDALVPDVSFKPFQEHRETFLASGTLTIPEGGRYCRLYLIGGGSERVNKGRRGGETTVAGLSCPPSFFALDGYAPPFDTATEYMSCWRIAQFPTPVQGKQTFYLDEFNVYAMPGEWLDRANNVAYITTDDARAAIWTIPFQRVDIWLDAGDHPVVIGAPGGSYCGHGAVTVTY